MLDEAAYIVQDEIVVSGTDPIKRSKESVIYFLSCHRRDASVLPGVVLHRSEPHCFSPSRNLAG
jgi:hypothetical protein